VLRRVQSALLAEWGYVMALTPLEAELQFSRFLKPVSH
jgi:hypothetical protein